MDPKRLQLLTDFSAQINSAAFHAAAALGYAQAGMDENAEMAHRDATYHTGKASILEYRLIKNSLAKPDINPPEQQDKTAADSGCGQEEGAQVISQDDIQAFTTVPSEQKTDTDSIPAATQPEPAGERPQERLVGAAPEAKKPEYPEHPADGENWSAFNIRRALWVVDYWMDDKNQYDIAEHIVRMWDSSRSQAEALETYRKVIAAIRAKVEFR